jgi:hypothetical protein
VAIAFDRPVMVDPRLARQTMEVYVAADLSAERHQVVELPLGQDQPARDLAGSTSS